MNAVTVDKYCYILLHSKVGSYFRACHGKGGYTHTYRKSLHAYFFTSPFAPPPPFPPPLKLTHSILGPDSGVGAGECHHSLVGPFVGFHHQALLIAAIWPLGRGNVGYGANVGSNHTSRQVIITIIIIIIYMWKDRTWIKSLPFALRYYFFQEKDYLYFVMNCD